MQRAATVVLFGALLFGCRTMGKPDGSEAKAFYRNSLRRSAFGSEVAPLGRLGGCAAFFVANSLNRPLVVSAKHCMNEDPEGWCRSGWIRSEATGQSASCRQILAWRSTLDIVLFELDRSIASGTLRIAAFAPEPGTRLRLLGYPGDRYAPGGPAVTENCWVRRQLVASPHNDTLDQSAVYNCSVYGGNSGGPVTIDSTDLVIGLPYTYDQDRFGNEDPWDSLETDEIALFLDFAAAFDGVLTQYGVTVVRQQTTHGRPRDAILSVGRCTSAEMPTEPVYLTPEYNTGTVLASLHIEFERSQYKERYPCSGSVCTSTSDGDGFRVLNPSSVEYTARNGARSLYACPR